MHYIKIIIIICVTILYMFYWSVSSIMRSEDSGVRPDGRRHVATLTDSPQKALCQVSSHLIDYIKRNSGDKLH